MPTLVTCRNRGLLEKEWNAASDDFVIPAVGSIVFNLFSITIVLAVLYPLYFAFSCPSPSPLFYGSFFALLFFDVVAILVEGVILAISAKGSILQNAKSRKRITIILYIKILVELIKIVVLIICTYASISADVASKAINCPVYKIMLKISIGAVAFLWIRSILFVARGCIYIDPLGICTRGPIERLGCLDRSMNENLEPQKKLFFQPRKYKINKTAKEARTRKRVNTHRGHVGLRRRLNAVCCCVGVGDQISRASALEDMAKAIHTLFDFSGEDSEIVVRNENNYDVFLSITDVLAGLKLLKRAQKSFKEEKGEHELRKTFIEETRKKMPKYDFRDEDVKEPREIKLSDSGKLSEEMDNLAYYIAYAMGMYGWSFHIFAKPYCGLCELSSVTCCVCGYRCCMSTTARQAVLGEGLCLCHLGALRLRASIRPPGKTVVYANYTSGIYRVPYSVCADEERKTIVIAVRGTLSLKDALTDVSFPLVKIDVQRDDCTGNEVPIPDSHVHKGMLKAAMKIRRTLIGHRVLKEAFKTYKDYKLVLTGHSLGAGVASILAIILKERYPHLVCYAYSPPGCTCSLPIANFTRDFVTSVVLGNDIVPRVSFRSLLHLKYMVIQFLLQTTTPKYNILLPSFCTQCREEEEVAEQEEFESVPSVEGETRDHLHVNTGMLTIKDIEKGEVTEETFKGVKKVVFRVQTKQKRAQTPRTIQKYESVQMSTENLLTPSLLQAVLKHCHPDSQEKLFMPAFVPGRVLHFVAPKTTSTRRCFGSCSPSEFVMREVSNEELCVIEVDKGMVSDHLPNKVFEALQAYKKQVDRKGFTAPAAGAPPLPSGEFELPSVESETGDLLHVNTDPDHDLWSEGDLTDPEAEFDSDTEDDEMDHGEEDGRVPGRQEEENPEQPTAQQFSVPIEVNEDYCTEKHYAQLASAAEESMLSSFL